MRNLANKLALVTGGGQGIGLRIARELADERCEIVVTDARREPLDSAVAAIEGRGARAHAYVMDVTDETAVRSVREQVHEQLGRIDILVNNAGVVFGGPFLDVPLDRHLLTYKVNIEGLVTVTYTFLPDLIGKSESHLVNVASASGLIGLPNGSTYASSKWAVIGFSESIRLELEELGHEHVKVTTVCPSYVNTGMFAGVKVPIATKMLDPDRLAARVVEAVEHDDVFVLEPLLVRATPLLKALLPTHWFDRVAKLTGASTSMQGWRGHG